MSLRVSGPFLSCPSAFAARSYLPRRADGTAGAQVLSEPGPVILPGEVPSATYDFGAFRVEKAP